MEYIHIFCFNVSNEVLGSGKLLRLFGGMSFS
jgi:hypothetical protein